MRGRRGRCAVWQGGCGRGGSEMLARGHRLEVGSTSIIGWVTANRQPRVASDVTEDPMHLRNELLPQTRSEVGIPIMLGNLVLGAMDVQSTEPGAFTPDAIVMLQLIASQIAVAIQNVGLVQSTQINFADLERLQRSSRELVAARSGEEALQVLARILTDAPYSSLIMKVDGRNLVLESDTDASRPEVVRARTAVSMLGERLDEIQRQLSMGPGLGESDGH